MAHIKTFARLKPCKRRAYEDYEVTDTSLVIHVPDMLRDACGGAPRTRTSTVNHEFTFTHVFDTTALQQQVFDTVAKDIVNGFLNGYNGTIFAYGQTGSGKTYTVEGGGRLYEERGLASRALSMIYNSLEAQSNVEATVHVSYMEIYQEVGYDLLNQAARSSSAVTPFPKVAVVEGRKGSCTVRNLSTHLAANEAVAQSLLLQGQANRKVAETPMNQRSSRSHAVFTIQLTAKKDNDDITTKSKLHLVDLAGSERVSKTGINGRQLAEAKYINLSLHHLEGVIIALHQDAVPNRPQSHYSSFYKRVLAERIHPYRRPRSSSIGGGIRPSSAVDYQTYSAMKYIPYRNSLLTMVLKDSLGGNCLTAMIATVSLEEENLSESLSTCRFSQRVACITNTIRRNEEIDDKLMIKRLRKRIAELEAELALHKSGLGGSEPVAKLLEEEDTVDCRAIVKRYVGGEVSDPILAGVTTPQLFRQCMKIFKVMVTQASPSSPALQAWPEEPAARPKTVPKNMKVSCSKSRDFINQSRTSKNMSLSTPDVTKMTSEPVNDVDHKMAQMSLYTGSPVRRVSSLPSYKSPFERKREKAIKQLAEQVKKKRNEQQEQFQHLETFKASVMEQQLEQLQKELQAKAADNRKLLESQRMCVKQLMSEGVDEDLYQQEKTVERQLRKRQAKMEKRLGLIGENIARVRDQQTPGGPQQAGTEQTAGTPPDPTKMKGFGTVVNSRMVLDKLREEDKQQLKRQTKMEKDRRVMLSWQVSLKEAATRQKLREFKEKLSQSRNGSSLSDQPHIKQLESPDLLPRHDVTNTVVDMEDEEEEEEPVRDTNKQPPQTLSHVMSENLVRSLNRPAVMSSPDLAPTNAQTDSRESSVRPRPRRKEAMNFDERWSKSYTSSRPMASMDGWRTSDLTNRTFTDPFTVSTQVESFPITEAGYEDLPTELITSNYHGNTDHKDLEHDPAPSPQIQPKLKTPPETTKGQPRQDLMAEYPVEEWPPGAGGGGAGGGAGGAGGGRGGGGGGAGVGDGDLTTPGQPQHGNRGKSEGSRKGRQPPKTFESVLESMLAMEGPTKPGPLTIAQTEYDEFARSKPQDSTPQACLVYSQKPKTHSSRVHRGRNTRRKELFNSPQEAKPPQQAPPDAWGPEAKHVSVSERLSRYLDVNLMPSPRPKAGRSYEDSDAAPYKTPQVVDDMSPLPLNKHNKSQPVIDLDIDDFTPKIKALPEKSREKTYMNTVKEQKDRVSKIRKARRAAEIIQRAWAAYRHNTSTDRRNGKK